LSTSSCDKERSDSCWSSGQCPIVHKFL
jgi:hypothetical protein